MKQSQDATYLERAVSKWIDEWIVRKPGISTAWLFENRPRVGKEEMDGITFDECLDRTRIEKNHRTANGLWWPAGFIGEHKDPKPPRKGPDPRQVPLFEMGDEK